MNEKVTPLPWQQIGPTRAALLYNTDMRYKVMSLVSRTWFYHLHTREKLSDIAWKSVGSLQAHKRILLMVIMVIFAHFWTNYLPGNGMQMI